MQTLVPPKGQFPSGLMGDDDTTVLAVPACRQSDLGSMSATV